MKQCNSIALTIYDTLYATKKDHRGQENTIVTLTLLYLAISVGPDNGTWCERVLN